MTTHRVVSEREIYLDSDYASYERSHEFEFKLDPPVQTDMNQKAYISVRHFSCLNTLKNITIDRRQFAVARLVNGVSLTYNREIPEGHLETGQEFADMLNRKFYPKDAQGNPTATIEDTLDSDFGKPSAYVQFTWLQEKQHMLVEIVDTATAGAGNLTLYGEIFELLNFEVNTNLLLSGESTAPVDVNREVHSLYVTCKEVTENHVNTANDIPNRIIKIQNTAPYGGYITYDSNLPVQKNELDKHTTTQFTLKLVDNNGFPFIPDRFFFTIHVEILEPVIEKINYWTDEKGTLLAEQERSRHPPIRYLKPNDERCPSYTNSYK